MDIKIIETLTRKDATLVGVWKCCLPWCAPAEGKAAPPTPPAEVIPESPPRARQPSPHLQDIAEEDSEEETILEEPTTLQPLGAAKISYKKQRRNVQSPSPTLSAKASRKSQRNRSITSTTSSECSSSGGGVSSAPAGSAKMQAEQGSIGDLHRYHNRYLRNRRHTLANVR